MSLTTERVKSGTRAPIVVVLVLVAFVGLLVFRPWDQRRPAATPVAVGPTPQASGPQASADTPLPSDAPPSPTPARTPRTALPTPDVAPLGPAGEIALFAPPDQGLVQCNYRRNRRAERLIELVVQPPLVVVDPDTPTRHISRMSWWFQVETNQRHKIFTAAWRAVGRSRVQVATAVTGRPAAFTAISIPYEPAGNDPTLVVRARIVVEWYTRNEELAGRTEALPYRYREADDPLDAAWLLHCDAIRTPG